MMYAWEGGSRSAVEAKEGKYEVRIEFRMCSLLMWLLLSLRFLISVRVRSSMSPGSGDCRVPGVCPPVLLSHEGVSTASPFMPGVRDGE